MHKGIAASQGIAIAKVFKLEEPEIIITNEVKNKEEELAKLESAFNQTIKQIETIKEYAKHNISEEELAIFDAHLMMANDPEFLASIKMKIEEGLSAAKASDEVAKQMIMMFEAMDNDYFKERAADIKDVSFRLLCNILDKKIPDLSTISEEVIIVAKDLSPSDTASLNKQYTKGFVTEIGGRTSHSAIMARSLEIPAVVGIGAILDSLNDNDLLILDALNGEVIINPDHDTILKYEKLREEYLNKKEALKVLINAKSETVDGHEVEIACNIGTPKDAKGALENGAEGIGLYRTEFLYMDSKDNFPSEENQFEAYKEVLLAMNNKRVVVRTLDIGGDKTLDYFDLPKELNPFLGYRAIRLCLDLKEVFRTQLRALLRASIYGKLAIMFPMIATVDEFKAAKAIFEEEKEKLISEGQKVSENIEIGMMIEIPAAAVNAKNFAKYADFFSIGTNDLIQYSMAADRMNEKVSYLYQPLNPSILNLIKLTIDGAHAHGKWVGMCGEMAGDPNALPILLGLGLDEFSMSASAVLNARSLIRSLSKEEMSKLASSALEKDNELEVLDLVKKVLS